MYSHFVIKTVINIDADSQGEPLRICAGGSSWAPSPTDLCIAILLSKQFVSVGEDIILPLIVMRTHKVSPYGDCGIGGSSGTSTPTGIGLMGGRVFRREDPSPTEIVRADSRGRLSLQIKI